MEPANYIIICRKLQLFRESLVRILYIQLVVEFFHHVSSAIAILSVFADDYSNS